MKRFGLILTIAALAAAAVWNTSRGTVPTQDKAAAPAAGADDAAAGVRKNAADYTAAFNAGDAKAAAMSWTADGEYTDPDGETHRGRAAIEQELTAFFKANPKATVEITVESVRPLGKQIAVAEGIAKTLTPTDPAPTVSRFSGTFIREDDGWKIASLTDWVPDPATDVPVSALGWLVGEWGAKGDGGELKIVYAWDESKVFLRGTYTLTKDGKTASSGMHIIGRDPAGGLRGWVFDGSGTFGDSIWTRDGSRWLSESSGTLPDGTEVTAINILVPLGPDAFTWQTTARTVGETDLPDQVPVKVTRVGQAK